MNWLRIKFKFSKTDVIINRAPPTRICLNSLAVINFIFRQTIKKKSKVLFEKNYADVKISDPTLTQENKL